MRRHLTGLFQRAAVLEVSRDPSAAEGVIAHLRDDGGRVYWSGDGRGPRRMTARRTPYTIWYSAIAITARVSVLLGCRNSSRIVK